MKTGLKDFYGHNIHEGDYLQVVPKSLSSGTLDYKYADYLSKIGRVVWDTRRREWQLMRMYIPHDTIRPEVWGRARVDWLNEYTAIDCELVIDGGYRMMGDTEWRASKKLKGDWHPKTFRSGSVEVPYTTWREDHKKE